MGLWDDIAAIKDKVDSFILSNLEDVSNDSLKKASLHLIKAGGKRLRPFITVTVCKMLGGSEHEVIPVASAIELVHNFTLIHDDIMDQDAFRRGTPTVHTLWGIPMAIIAGDLLFSKAFSMIFKNVEGGETFDERRSMCAHLLANAINYLAIGQAMDIEFEKRWDVTEDEYFQMIKYKTAFLFGAASLCGGVIAGASSLQMDLLKDFGLSYGVLFQLTDDLLGLIGDPKKTGKPVGSDVRRGKKTLPIIYALSKVEESEKTILLDVLSGRKSEDSDVKLAISIIEGSGAIDYTRERVERYASDARKALEKLPQNEYNAKLQELVEYTISRTR